MTAFPTCHTCAKPAVSCATLAVLKASIAGLGLTSVKHRCADYAAAFAPGDAVKVNTFAWFHRDDDPPPKLDFPGHFIRLVGQRALVFVPPKSFDLNGEDIEFEPNGNGFLKVPLGRLAHRDAPSADVRMCQECGAEPGLGQPCARDPIYGRLSRCLAATSPAKFSAKGSEPSCDEGNRATDEIVLPPTPETEGVSSVAESGSTASPKSDNHNHSGKEDR